jgi:hypothetical protein
MPQFNQTVPSYNPTKKNIADWSTFRKGLNLLLRPTELDRAEYAVGDNILLKGSGVPTGRWGTSEYFSIGSSGTVRGIGTYIQGSTNEIFGLTDAGYVEKKNGLLSTRIVGQSWPSGSIMRTEQLGGKTYLVSEDVPFTTYAGGDFSVFVTVSPPTGLYATNISGVSGTNRVSYKVLTNVPNGGHTEPSANYVLANLPSDLTKTSIKVSWVAPSAPSITGHELYRGREGDETFLTALPSGTTSYVDTGSDAAQTIGPPMTNTTGGIKSALIKKYQNRLLLVQGSKLLISAKYPDQSSFSLMDGGGEVEIDPDSGDDIVGIEVQPIADRIVVYKNRSSYLVKLDFVSIGPFYLMDPTYQPISTAVGCSNQDTIATVENDSFYFGRDGIYVTGYEPNFLNIIRTNEVSARIKPYFEKLGESDFSSACALYVDNKYILSFPRLKQMVVYDRERGCFAGIWKLPFGISHMKKYFDATGTEHWVIGSYDDNKVYEFIRSVNTDDGTAMIKTIRTNKEDFGDWTKISTLEFFYALFRAITGSVTVNIITEDRNGNNTIAKTFTITGAETSGMTGWGTDSWGTTTWGTTLTNEFSVSLDEVPRWGTLFKQVRSVQVEVTSTSTDSNFELLKLNMKAKTQSGVLSSSQRV